MAGAAEDLLIHREMYCTVPRPILPSTMGSPGLRDKLQHLVLLALLVLAAVLEGLRADLLEVLLERGEVLAGLGELALLHALADVPVDERTLGVHEVELVVEAGQDLRSSITWPD